jgi:hypothetical protein
MYNMTINHYQLAQTTLVHVPQPLHQLDQTILVAALKDLQGFKGLR